MGTLNIILLCIIAGLVSIIVFGGRFIIKNYILMQNLSMLDAYPTLKNFQKFMRNDDGFSIGDFIVVGGDKLKSIAIYGHSDINGNVILPCCFDMENGLRVNVPIPENHVLGDAEGEQAYILLMEMISSGYYWDFNKFQLRRLVEWYDYNIKKPKEDALILADFKTVIGGEIIGYRSDMDKYICGGIICHNEDIIKWAYVRDIFPMGEYGYFEKNTKKS